MKTFTVFAFTALTAFHFAAAEQPEYLASFDPAKGFKSAQTDLTEIFLQIAGSLEYYGSPEPYLRHVAKEHARIEALYIRKNGKTPKSFRPEYMTDDYFARLTANWNALSPKLGLAPFSKDVGNMMRNAIKGTRGSGTIVVEIFNKHQANVFSAMTGKGESAADFESLKGQLISGLHLNDTSVDERKFDIASRDAVTFALGIHGVTIKLFKRLDSGLNPTDAERVKAVLTSIFTDVGQAAQSELEAGIEEWAINRPSTAAK